MQRQVQEEAVEQTFNMVNNFVFDMALKSALELNIIDIILATGDGVFLSPSKIASKLPTKNPDAPFLLDRVLRLLASYDILNCSVTTGENGKVERLYGARPICKFLVKNDQDGIGGSLAPCLLLQRDNVFLETWFPLTDAIIEGGIPFKRAYGMSGYEYIETDQRIKLLFEQAMFNHTALIMKKILEVYKGFEGVKVLVDVGGGLGASLNIIASKYPHIKGINFDLPHVVANAPSYSGMEHVGGDMFVSIPEGDAILMKLILHNWSDEHCLKVVKNCWKALPHCGKVIIIDSIIPENNVPSKIDYADDVAMLVFNGGKGRTRVEFQALAEKSGFSGCEVICTAYNAAWVLELHKLAHP